MSSVEQIEKDQKLESSETIKSAVSLNVNEGIHPRDTLFRAIVKSWSDSNESSHALEWLKSWETRRKCSADAATLQSILRAIASDLSKENGVQFTDNRKTLVSRASELMHRLENMKDLGVSNDDAEMVNTYNSYILTLASGQEAEDVLESMKSANIESYNAAISVYARGGPDAAEQINALFLKLEERGISPNMETFVRCLSACASSKESRFRPDLAEKFIEKLKLAYEDTKDPSLKITTEVYNAALISSSYEDTDHSRRVNLNNPTDAARRLKKITEENEKLLAQREAEARAIEIFVASMESSNDGFTR